MLDLTHAKSIQINGKEVKKLEIRNRVIWEKKTFESLILSASSNIVSAGDTVTLSAQLADANNNPVNVSGENVTFEVTFIKKVDNVVCTSNTQTQLDINSFENGDEIQFEVSNISGGVGIFWYNSAGGGTGYSINSIVEGSTVKLVNDEGIFKVYVDDVFRNRGTVDPEWVAFGIYLTGESSSCTVSDYTHKHTETLNDITNSSGIASVSYLVKDTNTLNIKAKTNNIESNMLTLTDILFKPPLDGTDAITKWTNLTNTTSNGIYQSHGSFLTEGWSNEGLWQLDFDVQCNDWWYVGLMPLCDARINPFTDAKQSQYAAATWEGLSIPYGFSATWVKTCSFSKITDKNWHHVTMKKIASNQVQIFIDGGYEHIWQSDVFAGISELHFGTRDNPSSRNYGGIINFKNIIVKLL